MTATEEPKRRRGRPPSGGREAILAAALAILLEQGIANLTSREVAARAGVSDASVYYHFNDRAGLLEAVFAHAMAPLQLMAGLDEHALAPAELIRRSFAALTEFFAQALPVISAAQTDPELRASMAEYIDQNNLGPHKGVEFLGGYLRAQQSAGRVRADLDPDAFALIVIDSAFAAAARRVMLGHKLELLPGSEAVLAEITHLLD